MDPLSLTASIITVVSASTKLVKILCQLATIRNAPPLVLALNNELSVLRLNVNATQDLVTRQSKLISSHPGHDILSPDTVASVGCCLKKAESLVIELDCLLSPLLDLLLRSDSVAPKKWISWMKNAPALERLKQEIYHVRVELNSTLGILGLSTSLRMETIAYSIRNDLAKAQEDQARLEKSYRQYFVRHETLMEALTRIFVDHQQRSANQDHEVLTGAVQDPTAGLQSKKFSSHHGKQAVAITVDAISHSTIATQCKCCCHQKYSKRSPRLADRILGTLFTGYSGVPGLAPRCNVLICVHSCPSPDAMLALTYFFPTWFISGAITLALKQTTRVFYNIRVLRYVSYSSPIFQYAYQGDLSGMKALLKGRLGSPFDVTPETQRSLLGVAASRGHGEICDILLDAGADPFFVDYKNRSAVDIAWDAFLTNSGSAMNLKRLLAFSSSEYYVSKFNLGLLHRSVLGLNHLGIKPLLEGISRDAIDEKDANGQTALYWAALRGDSQAVSLLLGAGAANSSKNNHGAGILTAAIMSSNGWCVLEVLKNGCDTNYTQADGYTPLHHSCRYNLDVSIVRALLGRGADKNAKTALGHTPLMIATFNMRTAVAKFLIDCDVSIDIQGKDGGCALHHAIMAGDHHTVHYLLEHDANYRLKTMDGETLLHFLAQRNGDQEMIRILSLFDLDGIDVGGVTRSKNLTALQVAELHHECDVLWLDLFTALVWKIRYRHPCQTGYANASEHTV